MVLQAWFDESGKGQEPIYLLAGYVGKKTMWEAFADDWQAELDPKSSPTLSACQRVPVIQRLHPEERIERLLRFVAIIRKHQPVGITYILKHEEYREFFNIIKEHPTITPAERRMLKNPYYHSFTVILKLDAEGAGAETGTIRGSGNDRSPIRQDMDRIQRLKVGFASFVKSVKKQNPDYLDLLINKDAECRDDEVFLPLQACDLSSVASATPTVTR